MSDHSHIIEFSSDKEVKQFIQDMDRKNSMPGNVVELFSNFAGAAMRLESGVTNYKKAVRAFENDKDSRAERNLAEVEDELINDLDEALHLCVKAYNVGEEVSGEAMKNIKDLNKQDMELTKAVDSLNHYLIDRLVANEVAALLEADETLLKDHRETPLRRIKEKEPKLIKNFRKIVVARTKYIDNNLKQRIDSELRL